MPFITQPFSKTDWTMENDKLNSMRDEVLGEWLPNDVNYVYCVYLYIDSNFMPAFTAIRDAVFRKELPLALESMRYGDNEFF